jgi:SAM-dependent methyltransferase
MGTTHAPEVSPTNRDQFAAWDGEEGSFWADHSAHFDRAVARYQDALLAAAAIQPTDRVLDIGCGTGDTSRDAARQAGGGSVLGVDLSSAMLAAARRRAGEEGLVNVRFEQADAQIHPFGDASFDVVISRTGGTFFGDPVGAYRNIARALRPGGRLAMLAWQPAPTNEWISEIGAALAGGRQLPAPPPDAPGPFSFGDPEKVRAVLGSAGFTAVDVQPRRQPMWFGSDADDAYRLIVGVAGWMADGLDDDARQQALSDLRHRIEAHTGADGVTFGSATWLITARRPG